MSALLITLLSGLSFFIGYIITKFVSKGKKLVTFAVGFSFSIILGLAFTDLLPECLELLDNKITMIACMILGLALLKSLDLFIPDHDHDSKQKDHMEHIGLISAIALFLHNIIEGTAIYTTALTDIKMGLFMALGVAFHNIPLGIQISSLINKEKQRVMLITSLALSSIVGVIFINVFNIVLTDFITGILISVTFGMLMYISLFELLCEVKENFKKKQLKLGLILGIVFIVIGHFLH